MTEPQPWRVLASEVALDHSPWLRVIRQDVLLPNGARIPDYLLTPGRDFAMTVALTDDEQILLVKQYKHGLGRVVLDFPAGYLDTPAEDPLACAQRELREETGYAAHTWIPLSKWALDSNRSTTGAHLFFARGLTQVAEPRLDDTEALVHFAVPLRDIPALLQTEMPTLVCAAIWGLAAPYIFQLPLTTYPRVNGK
jgi:ADP-ribose pyrophosphatase